MAEVFTSEEDQQERSRSRFDRVKSAARWTGGVVAGGLVIGGSWLMFRDGNMEDFEDLRRLTSPAHQEDRQNLQDAFDAQDAMREHFAERDGPTDEEVAIMADFTGLDVGQVESLVTTELYEMDYDGDVPMASSQQATIGLVMAVAGTGGAVGAVAWAATRRH